MISSCNVPIVSVIVLTYNQESTVGRTLDSILSQRTDFAFEIIIGEDASPSDNTRAVCEQYAAQHPETIKLMPKAPNKGVLRNYVDCLKACRGKYIAACAGDDWWCDEGKLQMQVDFLETHDDYVLVHTDMQNLNVITGQITVPPIRTDVPQGDVRTALFGKPFIKAPTVCFRRAAVSDELLTDLWEQNFLLEDLPLWLILSQQGKFHFMPFHSVMYRISGGSASNNLSKRHVLAFYESIYDVKRYYSKKFSSTFLVLLIEKDYIFDMCQIMITSREWHYIKLAIERFGLFNVLNSLRRIVWHKIFKS